MRFPVSILLLIITLGVFSWPTVSRAQSCINDNGCAVGEICDYVNVSRQCGSLVVGFDNPTVSAVSFGGRVTQNGIGTMTVYGCLGAQSQCTVQPTTNTQFWRVMGTANGNQNVTYVGLRPGITYRGTFQGQAHGAVSNVQTNPVTTYPGFQTPGGMAVQVSNITDNSAQISWNTVFSSDTALWYGPAAPTAVNSFSTGDSTETITDMDALPNGEVWAVTNRGRAFYRTAAGAWSEKLNGEGYLQSVSAYFGGRAWVGSGGNRILYTTNSGTNWTTTTLGVADPIFDLHASTFQTVWAVTSTGRIYYQNIGVDPTAWTLKTTTGLPLEAITSIDNKSVWAVADSGYLVESYDGGTSWNNRRIGTSAEPMRSINTIDNQTLWAAGSSRVYVSTDGGTNWQPRTIGSGIITNIKLLDPQYAWVLQQGQIIQYDFSTGTARVYPTGGSFQNQVNAVALVNGGDLMIGNQAGNIGEFTVAGTYLNTGSGLTTSHSVTLPAGSLADGTQYHFAVVSYGQSVSAGMFGSFSTLSLDTVPPSINFTNPPSSPIYTNNASFTATGNASDNLRLQTISLTQNGTARAVTTAPTLGTGVTSATWSAPLTLTGGTNTLVATASDGSSGSSDTSANAQVILDTQAPTVSITTPADGSTINFSPTPFTGSAFDNDQIVLLEYSLNGGPRTSMGTAGAPGIAFNQNLDVTSFGPNSVTVYARDRAGNEGSATSNFTFNEPTFTVSATPSAQTRNAGDVVTYAVTVASQNGFSGTVNLSATGTPAGSTTTFNPQPVTLTAGATVNSTMSIATNVATTGNFTITITGNGGSKTASTNVTLELVPAPDFTLGAIPVARSVVGGQSTSYQITILSNASFSGIVNFSLSGTPAGVTGTLTPALLVISQSMFQTTSLGITTQPSTPAGNYQLTVTGTSGSLVRTVTITLSISAPPDITLNVTPPTQTIIAGQSTTYSATVAALNGFNEQVIVSATTTVAVAGLTMTVTPNQFIPSAAGSSATIAVQTSGAVPAGSYPITVTAANVDGSISKNVTVNLQVNPDTTPPIITNIVATPNWNSVRITWQTDELANSTIIIYADAARTTVVGITSDSTVCTNTCHDLVYQPLNPLTTYYFQVQSCDQAQPIRNCRNELFQSDGVTPLQFTTLDEPDLEPPTVTIDQPAQNSTLIGTVTIAGGATDNKNVSQVQIRAYLNGSQPTNPTFDQTITCTGTSCSYSTNWNTLTYANGNYTIEAIAVDAAGNLSMPATVVVQLDNDFTNPVLTCGVDVQTSQIAGQTSCGGGQCWQAIITWCTDDAATTQVDYGKTAAYTDGTVFGNPTDPSTLTTNHQVTLTNLDANQLYHYRITSCNNSNLCTH